MKNDLNSLVHGRGELHASSDDTNFLLTSANGRSPITVTLDGDIARIRAGFGIRVNVGSDVPSDDQTITEVVEAILDGAAEEFFDLNSRGEMDAVAWRLWYPRGERTGGTHTADAISVRLLPW
ncbi:MAG: hypothetical protein EPN91_08080 [Salinibacterium sp.]|nr:MAG: hypothetical protein EPN91_08080 [Salinibacterium sp.]